MTVDDTAKPDPVTNAARCERSQAERLYEQHLTRLQDAIWSGGMNGGLIEAIRIGLDSAVRSEWREFFDSPKARLIEAEIIEKIMDAHNPENFDEPS